MSYSESQVTFQKANQTVIPLWTLEIVIQEVLLSIRGSCSTIWRLLLTNEKWHSDRWPVAVISQPTRLTTNFMTLIPTLIFTELWVDSIEHLQRVWHASRERLPFRTWFRPAFWDLLMLELLRQVFSRTCHVFSRLLTLNNPRYFLDFALFYSTDTRLMCILCLSRVANKWSFIFR